MPGMLSKTVSLVFPFSWSSWLLSLFLCLATSSPIPAPDISNCRINPSVPYDCCPPLPSSPAKPFQFPSVSTVKVRRPAHKLSDEEAQKLSSAYLAMKHLPYDDPRAFGHQANIHCAYCCEFYLQGNSSAPLQIHGSWLFFSFHRWYLYFHERMLAKLIGDDTLAIPFWNYDHPEGSSIPPMYFLYDGLFDINREPAHLPPAVVAADTVSLQGAFRDREDQLNINRACFYFVMVSAATTPYRFFGQPYRYGDKQAPGFGSCETMPHDGVHAWVGNHNSGMLDMGWFAVSARDPVFYAHHSSLDRLWEVWKSLSENNVDIDDPDYLNTEFVFYDENAELVTVTVRDSLNISLLGYTFEEVENLWLNVTPVSLSVDVATLGEGAVICQMGEALAEPCSAIAARNKLLFSTSHAEAETLVIQGIHLNQTSEPVQFNVFVNLPTADASTLMNCTEFAGAFSTVPTTHSIDTSMRLGIAFIVEQLNLTSEDSLVITLVPTTDATAAVSITSIAIEYDDVGGSSASHRSEK